MFDKRFGLISSLEAHPKTHGRENSLCDHRCAHKQVGTTLITTVWFFTHVYFANGFTSHMSFPGHAGVKPCACSACDHRSSHKWNLDSRMQSRHMWEKPYGCDECGGKFQLTEHGRVVMNYVLMSNTISLPGIRGEGSQLSHIFNST